MKPSTLVGILIGLGAIFGAFFWEGGQFSSLFMLPAMLIVFGGTLAAGLAGSSFAAMASVPKLIWITFFPPKYHLEILIEQIVEMAMLARREGILAIEKKIPELEHPFLAKLFKTCVDGADPETMQHIAESEIDYITQRHNSNIELFSKMGGYSPTMGIIGTVMGLISTLASAGEDPNKLIHHIASAFIATMWGILMANIVWLPISDKLRSMHNEEMYINNVLLTGVLGVMLRETPSVIRARLISAFPLSEQEKIMEKQIMAEKDKK